MDDILKIESELELQILRKEIEKLKKENHNLLTVIHENDLDDELGKVKPLSSEEQICIKGIDMILELIESGTYTSNDVKDFDILNKNLRMIRGHDTDSKKKVKPAKVVKEVIGSIPLGLPLYGSSKP